MNVKARKTKKQITGVEENILTGILAEMNDISRFYDVKEIQKLSMGLVSCSSDKHKEQTKIRQLKNLFVRIL